MGKRIIRWKRQNLLKDDLLCTPGIEEELGVRSLRLLKKKAFLLDL